jgi:pathogenesis-related protein 1
MLSSCQLKALDKISASELKCKYKTCYKKGEKTPYTGYVIYNYENGKEHFRYEYKDGKKDGKVVEFDKNDNIIKEGVFKNGKLISKKTIKNNPQINTLVETSKNDSDIEPENMKGITKAHNVVRRKLGVSELVWSSELAKYAQVWANYLKENNNCKMKHRPRYGKYKQVHGENLSWFSAVLWSDGKREFQNISPSRGIQGWIDEVKDYDYSRNKCNSGKVCGHYTQLVWENSKKLGCAMVTCDNKEQIWVCNYDPPGNYVGQKPY